MNIWDHKPEYSDAFNLDLCNATTQKYKKETKYFNINSKPVKNKVNRIGKYNMENIMESLFTGEVDNTIPQLLSENIDTDTDGEIQIFSH